MDTKRWNTAFTSMIRQTDLAAWGNWTLDPFVRPGAVGFINAETASFQYVADLPNAPVTHLAASEDWSIENSSVHRSESAVDFKGGYKDPTTGTEVNTGLGMSWNFSKEGSVASNATIVGRAVVDNFGKVMQDNYDWLLNEAKSVGYATDGGIAQGFGMITGVQLCSGGVNIGSLNSKSTFSLTGSVDGINAMTGAGSVDAGLTGSYRQFDETNAFERHLWPSESNTAAPADIAIDYAFSSFDGRLLMPTWIMPLSGFTIKFDNAHGGTYIADCKVTYDDAGTSHKKDTTVPGGQVHTIDGIPLSATNLKVHIDFEAGDDFHFRWQNPIATWPTGHRTIDLSGVWPWGAHAKVREESWG